jgi:hypothetical protein
MGDQNKRVLRAKIARRELLLTARDEEGPFDEWVRSQKAVIPIQPQGLSLEPVATKR